MKARHHPGRIACRPRHYGEARRKILAEPGLVGIQPAHNIVLPLAGRQLHRQGVGMAHQQPRPRAPAKFVGRQHRAGRDLRHHPAEHLVVPDPDGAAQVVQGIGPARVRFFQGILPEFLQPLRETPIQHRRGQLHILELERRHRHRFGPHGGEPVARAGLQRQQVAQPQHAVPARQGQIPADPGLDIKSPHSPHRIQDPAPGPVGDPLRHNLAAQQLVLQPGGNPEAHRGVLIQHHQAPVGRLSEAGGVREVHAHGHTFVADQLAHIAEFHRVGEAGAALPRDVFVEEETRRELEARDHHEQQGGAADHEREESADEAQQSPVRHRPQPPEEVPPGAAGPRRAVAHFLIGQRQLRVFRHVDQRHHEQKTQGAGREQQQQEGKAERNRQHAGDHDQKQSEDDQLQVLAFAPVGSRAVEHE